MNTLVEELRQFGTVNFDDDSHADWILDQYEFRFKITFEDIGINLIGARLTEFKYKNIPIDMSGEYIIRPDTSQILKVALEDLYSYHDVILPENFCESFLEFRLPDQYTNLLKHYRYMTFLQTPIGTNTINARSFHDEMCSYGYNITYSGNVIKVIGLLSGYDFSMSYDIMKENENCEIYYSNNVYKYSYKTGQDGKVLSVIKKFIDMVNL